MSGEWKGGRKRAEGLEEAGGLKVLTFLRKLQHAGFTVVIPLLFFLFLLVVLLGGSSSPFPLGLQLPGSLRSRRRSSSRQSWGI